MAQTLTAEDFYPANRVNSPQVPVSDSRDMSSPPDGNGSLGTLPAMYWCGFLIAAIGIRVAYELSD